MTYRPKRPAPERPRAAGTGRVRIIGGRWKRRVLEVVDAPGLRPTSDRVRETLFNWLVHAFGGDFTGRSALDLYAGSGALGFEAASRGADPVVLVESGARALERLRAARDTLGATQCEVRAGDAITVARQFVEAGRRFDLVLLDPPFGQDRLDNALPLATALCKPDGFVYVEAEFAIDTRLPTVPGLEPYRADRAGEVFYHLLRRNIKT